MIVEKVDSKRYPIALVSGGRAHMLTKEEAKVVLREHGRFLQAEGEYYFTCQPPYTIEEVNQAKEILQQQ